MTINNFCTCESYDEDGHPEPFDCDGECFVLDKEYFGELFQEWLDRNGALETAVITPKVVIRGSAMNWNRVSGVAVVDCDYESVLQALSIDSEYTLRISLSGSALKVVRSSHDEYGARFDFTLVYDLAD